MVRILINALFLSFILLSGTDCNEKPAAIKENSHLEVIYVDKDILTPFSINCEHFQTFFASTTKKIVVTDKQVLAKVQNCFKKGRDNSNVPEIDVRVKVGFYENGSIIASYCLDKFGNIIFNEKVPIENKCLVDLINEIISGSGKSN